MTRFGMCCHSLLGAGCAWFFNSAGECSCPMFPGSLWTRLQLSSCPPLCMVDCCVASLDWLSSSLHGCAGSAWLLHFCKVTLLKFWLIPLPYSAGRAALLRLLSLAWLAWLASGSGLPSFWLFSMLMVCVFCL